MSRVFIIVRLFNMFDIIDIYLCIVRLTYLIQEIYLFDFIFCIFMSDKSPLFLFFVFLWSDKESYKCSFILGLWLSFLHCDSDYVKYANK